MTLSNLTSRNVTEYVTATMSNTLKFKIMTYSILAKVTVSKVVEVEAEDLDEARDKVESAFMDGTMKFTSEDFDNDLETCKW